MNEPIARRRISFAGSTVEVEYAGERAAQIVDFLFGRFAADGQPEPHQTLRLVSDGNTLAFSDSSEPELSAAPSWAAPWQLLGRVNYHLVDRSHGGVVIHAAAVAWNGCGLIMPGHSGAGKTTLTAWLLTQGFHYLTDELIFIPEAASSFQAFARPLSLKPGAWQLLATAQPHPWPLSNRQQQSIGEGLGVRLSSPYGDIVPPEALSQQPPLDAAPLHLIVFPRFQAGAALEFSRVSAAEACLGLMQQLNNARNLPQHGFPEAVRLARATPAYRLNYGSLAQLEGVLEGERLWAS